ncbi:GatB/YqeY domain-containing protein [Spirulina sp. 06S082]|uniref:GatB/YqeY domain-containing protein n=1 Tax=Spirulina sp. 06S082 TaxID=3110248 RepID=UPI002B1EA4A3|nr:GatB/YqeY domain-containing protein [Spirulina sp. 06S082]MEA5469580.1 GatB/YqeY domain-containing protein [Spirulina sp. 06S082]
MSLKDRLTENIKTAMKAKDKIRLETIRSIKKAVMEKEISLRPEGQDTLTEAQELDILAQQAKQRRDSIEQYSNAGRDDLADREAQELVIIEEYLPQQLSEEELSQLIDEIITKVGAKLPKNMGKVMGMAMKQLKGKADGKQVQAMVKAKLGNG